MIINTFKFNFYGVLLVSSIIIGFIYIFLSLKKEKEDINQLKLYALLFFSFTFVFGKIFTIVVSKEPVNIINAGFSSYGGLIGVISSAIIFEKIVPMNKKLIKYSILSLPLVYSVSKIGCFLAGCCYGIPYDGLFSVTYTSGLNIKLFPIQLTESIVFLIIFLILNRFKNNKNIIYITIIISALMKYLLDFLRYEHINKFITVNQVFSLILIIGTFIILIINEKKLTKNS